MSDAPTDSLPLDGSLFGNEQPCFGCGPAHPIGFRLKFERDGESAITTRFTPGASYQGPPGIMHGGLVMTLADEIAAWALIGLLGKFGFTGNIEAKLRSPVRIGVEVEGRATIVRDGGRVVRVGVVLKQNGSDVFAGEFGFAVLDRAAAEKMLGGPLPREWERFAR